VRSKKDIFDLGKKMTVDKRERRCLIMYQVTLLNEMEKKKELEGRT